MSEDLEYEIALSMTPGVTAEVVRHIAASGITVRQFFEMPMAELSLALDISRKYRFQDTARNEALQRARREVEFMRQHSIRALFMLNEDYPYLLREIPDPPIVLYCLGKADLNAQPAMNIVGTRRCTPYGTNFSKTLVEGLAPYFPNLMVVSGLAYGIDASAHLAALEKGVTTVAVVAHGLDMIYPAAHRDIARRIIAAGGAIVTEYPTGTKPFRKNFLERNRIIAALCELTFVVESEVKGGAMSTANQAFCYDRIVMALPGRATDQFSAGCNKLIANQKAYIYTDMPTFLNITGWRPEGLGKIPPDRTLFPELEPDQSKVYEFLQKAGGAVAIDMLHQQLSMPMSTLIGALTELEFEGLILKLPGARYEKA